MEQNHNQAHRTIGRVEKVYRGLMEEMMKNMDIERFSKQVIVKAEVLKRPFTKRQYAILHFIYTFSLEMGKDEAYINQLQDFEYCGISRTKIRDELKKLKDMNVIGWDEEGKVFWIEDPQKWKMPYHRGYSELRGKSLLFTNLVHGEMNVMPIIKRLKEEGL